MADKITPHCSEKSAFEEMYVETSPNHQRVYLEDEYLRWFCEDGSDLVTHVVIAQELGTSTFFSVAILDKHDILSEHAGKDT